MSTPERPLRLALLDHALDGQEHLAHVVHLLLQVRAARDLAHHHGHERRVVPPGAKQDLGDAAKLLVRRLVRQLDGVEPLQQLHPSSRGTPSPAPRPWRRSSGTGGRARYPPPRRCPPHARCGSRRARTRARPRPGSASASPRSMPGARPAGASVRLNGQSTRLRIGGVAERTQPLAGILVVELARYLPGAFAGRELLRLGARVVRVEAPEGDPMRRGAPAWDRALRAGKESVTCDLHEDAGFARALCARADVVLEGFRPGVAARLGIGPDDVPATTVYCSITGFGAAGRHAQRAGHDLNYLGWAGVLEDTARDQPAGAGRRPRGRVARGGDRGAGGARAARLAPARARASCVSMTHRSHDLVAHRLGGDTVPRQLTGGLACYRDVPHRRRPPPDRCGARAAVLRAPLRAPRSGPTSPHRQFDADQDALAAELAAIVRLAAAGRLAGAVRRRGRLRRPGRHARRGPRRSGAVAGRSRGRAARRAHGRLARRAGPAR